MSVEVLSLPTQPNIGGQGKEPTHRVEPCQGWHFGKLEWFHSQTIYLNRCHKVWQTRPLTTTWWRIPGFLRTAYHLTNWCHDNQHNDTRHSWQIVTLSRTSFYYKATEWSYTDCCDAEFYYAECHFAKCQYRVKVVALINATKHIFPCFCWKHLFEEELKWFFIVQFKMFKLKEIKIS